MSSSRIDLKNPALAAVLAWLVPGLGHAYQGRWFKAALYSICIWSTFGCGWVLGDGKVVYTELVPEITQEPDYDKALAAVKR